MHTKQKKKCPKKPHNTPRMHTKQANGLYSNFEKLCEPRVFPVFHVARGRKTLQTYGFPIQTYGKTLKGRNFNSKV